MFGRHRVERRKPSTSRLGSRKQRRQGRPGRGVGGDAYQQAEHGRGAEQEALDTEIRRAVKPKKMHEIVRLSRLADEVARA